MDLLGRELYVGAIVLTAFSVNDYRVGIVIKLGKNTAHVRLNWTNENFKTKTKRKQQSSCLMITPAELTQRYRSLYEQDLLGRRDVEGNFVVQGTYDWQTKVRSPEQTFTLDEMVRKHTRIIILQHFMVQGEMPEYLGEPDEEEEKLLYLP